MANMTEDQIQQAVIRWSQQASVRKMFPQLALLYHIHNERKCTPQQGARLKRMGVKSGVPDLHLPVARGAYHGLYLEMKTEKGRVSANQAWWLERLRENGCCCVVCRRWEDAAHTLVTYLTEGRADDRKRI